MKSQNISVLAGFSLALSALLPGQVAAKTTVDVMLLYTPGAASKVKDINAHITNLVEYANQSYLNSDVNMQLNVVHTEAIANDYGSVSGATLKKFTDDQKIAGLRKQYGADLVTLITLRKADICGSAWVPQGDSTTGKFKSTASGFAYSVIGAECGLLAYVHQLGHNMGLGHSAQNENPSGRVGGIFPWARGHGIDGLFTTIMAYPKNFNGAKHVQQFSSPVQIKCKDQPCGVDKSASNGANAVENLIIVAEQVANFAGSAKPDSDDDKPNSDLCKKPHMANNLITGGDFNNLNPWGSYHNSSVSLSKIAKQKPCGKDNILSIKNRKAFYDGVIQDITEKVKPEVEYEISAKMKIDTEQQVRDTARIALQITDEVGVHYQYLVNESITSNEMSQVKDKFKIQALGEVKKVQVLLFGPKAEYALNVDEVKLTQVDSEPPKPDKDVFNHHFEQNLHNWIPFFGVDQLTRSKEAASEGEYSMKVTGRSHWYSGPALDVKGILESGRQYQLSLNVRQAMKQSKEQLIDIQLFYVDDVGYHWHRVKTASLPAGEQWTTVSGNLSYQAKGAVKFIHLYLFGPEPGMDFFIDRVSVKKN
ncbi:biofilm-associated metzincin protease Mep72 [Spartinivicinus ruber]|uniref:carbohydrate binding domain-containing protein n=1 Tax=Spartinivicinus ruber TaxID=2683272 RepID=UPI0013D220A3|nr:carbohydrate binding domain-containing protein [Spartinivicinus ruber]